MAETLGKLNPLRYRGYVYDEETELYYLQSRYYDPQIGRFLNADNTELLGANGDFNSLNLFAYCGNNPVNREDPSGNVWLAAAAGGAVAGAIISATSYIVGNKLSGNAFSAVDFATAIGIGAINGAIGGAAGSLGTKLVVLGATLEVGVTSGLYAASQTDGSVAQKVFTGILTGVVAGMTTFLGTTIYTGELTTFATYFSNYAITLMLGTSAEMLTVTGQQNIDHFYSSASNSVSSYVPDKAQQKNHAVYTY